MQYGGKYLVGPLLLPVSQLMLLPKGNNSCFFWLQLTSFRAHSHPDTLPAMPDEPETIGRPSSCSPSDGFSYCSASYSVLGRINKRNHHYHKRLHLLSDPKDMQRYSDNLKVSLKLCSQKWFRTSVSQNSFELKLFWLTDVFHCFWQQWECFQ